MMQNTTSSNVVVVVKNNKCSSEDCIRNHVTKIPCFTEVSSFSPFERIVPHSSSKPEIVQRIILRTLCFLILFPIRCIMLTFCITSAYILSKIALFGLPKNHSPLQVLAYWRAILVMSLRPITRLGLFSLGFVWINEKSLSWEDDIITNCNILQQTPPVKRSSDEAFVIVANHLGYLDILILSAKYGGAFVAKEALQNAPIVGVVSRALQTLFVHHNKPLTDLLLERVNATYDCHDAAATYSRTDTDTESLPYPKEYYHTDKEVCGSCLSNLVIFPEGTTTNGKSMVKFRTGIFRAGKPIQPIAIQLSSHSGFNLSWESIHFKKHLFYTMTQLYNYATITELPIYNPSEEEKDNVHLFTTNVQLLFSTVLCQDIYLLNRKHKALYHKYLLGKIDRKELFILGKEELEKDGTLNNIANNAA